MFHFNPSPFKFFTFLCCVLFVGFSNNAIGQIAIKDSTGRIVQEVEFGSKILYHLHSDTVLGVEMQPDYGVLISSDDSTLFFSDSSEVAVNDIAYLEIESKKIKQWRSVCGPALIAGCGFLIRGIVMASGEGLESKNEDIVPIYIGSGAIVASLSAIPFLVKNKSFDLKKSDLEIVVP